MTWLQLFLISLAILLVSVGAFALWYLFLNLARPQVFLVAVPYDDITKLEYSKEVGESLAKRFSGTVATLADLKDAFDDGLNLQQAGYVSDAPGTTTVCSGIKPLAYYPKISEGKPTLALSCSRGYWVKGVKPFKMNASIKGTDFAVQPWSDKAWNRYGYEFLEKL